MFIWSNNVPESYLYFHNINSDNLPKFDHITNLVKNLIVHWWHSISSLGKSRYFIWIPYIIGLYKPSFLLNLSFYMHKTLFLWMHLLVAQLNFQLFLPQNMYVHIYPLYFYSYELFCFIISLIALSVWQCGILETFPCLSSNLRVSWELSPSHKNCTHL